MNKTQYFAPRIRPNLLTEYCDLNTPNTWNVIGGGLIGTVTSSTEQVYDGTHAVKVDFASGGVIAFNSGNSYMNFTAPKDGAYCISGMVRNAIDHNLTVTFELFVNGISTNTYFESVLKKENGLVIGWNSVNQTLELNQNDVVSFNFRFGSTVARTVYLDSLKMELIDDGVYTPSPYSPTPYNTNNWHKREDLSNTQNLTATVGNAFGFAGIESKSDVNVSLVSSAGLIVPTKVGSFLRVYYSFDVLVLSGANQYVEIEVNVGGNLVPNGCTLVPIVKADTEMQTVSGSFGIDSYTYLLEQGLQISLRPTNAYTISKRMLIVEETR